MSSCDRPNNFGGMDAAPKKQWTNEAKNTFELFLPDVSFSEIYDADSCQMAVGRGSFGAYRRCLLRPPSLDEHKEAVELSWSDIFVKHCNGKITTQSTKILFWSSFNTTKKWISVSRPNAIQLADEPEAEAAFIRCATLSSEAKQALLDDMERVGVQPLLSPNEYRVFRFAIMSLRNDSWPRHQTYCDILGITNGRASDLYRSALRKISVVIRPLYPELEEIFDVE